MKFKLASLLDRLFPNTFCWFSLGMWAHGLYPFWKTFDNQECKDDMTGELRACYCGKFMAESLKMEFEADRRSTAVITQNIQEIAKEQGVR